jgi:hypothetical protein
MELRDHPLMIRKSGHLIWPPVWTPIDPSRDDKPVGEVGILEDVMMNELDDSKIFMFMQYQGLRYTGFMSFDDRMFCRAIYTLLQSKIGLSIKQIGDLDVSYTL